MAGFADILAALAIAQGAHTAGHFAESQQQGNAMGDHPMEMKGLEEKYSMPYKWTAPAEDDPYASLHQSQEDYDKERNRTKTDISGAGFASQDNIRNLIDDPELKKNVSLANAGIKGAYLAGVPSMMGAGEGDLTNMEKQSGNKYTKPMLGFSMLMDILKGTGAVKDNGVDVGFTTINGAPGLKVSGKW